MATNPFNELRKKLDATLKALPKKVGVMAVNEFQDSFKKQGWEGQRWKEVKRRLPVGRKTGKRSSRLIYRKGAARTRGILIGSGRLWRSIRVVRSTSTSVTVGTDVPYAKVHNEGDRAGRGSGFKMPKRQFMGNSRTLKRDIEAFIIRDIGKAFGK